MAQRIALVAVILLLAADGTTPSSDAPPLATLPAFPAPTIPEIRGGDQVSVAVEARSTPTAESFDTPRLRASPRPLGSDYRNDAFLLRWQLPYERRWNGSAYEYKCTDGEYRLPLTRRIRQ